MPITILSRKVCVFMKDEKLTLEESKLAGILRNEILKSSENIVKAPEKKSDLSKFELISENKKPYISPIFSMNEDEILAFVEEFEVSELATLSVAELNRIGEVLGVDPKILVEGED